MVERKVFELTHAGRKMDLSEILKSVHGCPSEPCVDSITGARPKILAIFEIGRVIYMHAHVYDPIELTRR